MHTCTHTHTHTHIHSYTHTNPINTYTHTHTNIHTHIHTTHTSTVQDAFDCEPAPFPSARKKHCCPRHCLLRRRLLHPCQRIPQARQVRTRDCACIHTYACMCMYMDYIQKNQHTTHTCMHTRVYTASSRPSVRVS